LPGATNPADDSFSILFMNGRINARTQICRRLFQPAETPVAAPEMA
jgi:hypothetical protein